MYSQNEEEKYILEYFDREYMKAHLSDGKGSFISIGENDGITLSNVRALAERGWIGIMVEPSAAAFAKLKDNYKGKEGFYFYNFALGTKNGMVPMWDSGTHLNKGDTGLLSTLSEDDKMKWSATTQFTEIKVQCFRWKTFLNRLKIKAFDFISIDAEGLDYDILSQIDLSHTSCVCVEFNGDANLKIKFDRLM